MELATQQDVLHHDGDGKDGAQTDQNPCDRCGFGSLGVIGRWGDGTQLLNGDADSGGERFLMSEGILIPNGQVNVIIENVAVSRAVIKLLG